MKAKGCRTLGKVSKAPFDNKRLRKKITKLENNMSIYKTMGMEKSDIS